MASEKIGYNVFPALPITGPVTSVAFNMDTATTGANVILTGSSFSARVQVSNAIVRGGPAHLFIPADASFDTAATLNAASPPTQIPGPFRYIRIVLDSGTLTGANIEETHGIAQSLDLNAASLAGQTAGAAAGAAIVTPAVDAALAVIKRPPLSTAASTRGVIFKGGVPYYPAPSGLLVDGVNITDEGANGLYYRATPDVMPWEYGALPGLNYVATNSGAALAAWTLGAPKDTRLYLPAGDWWTDRELVVKQTGLTLDFRGRLHPMPGYTGWLVNADAGYDGGLSYYETTMQNALWYKRIVVESMVLMGEARSRGVNFSRWDHFEISNITIHKTYGAAVRMDRMREGNAQNWQMQMCRAGSDNAVWDLSEQGPGDTQNVTNYRGIRIGAFVGRAMYYDSPYMNVVESVSPAIGAPGIPGRFINFDGLSVEDMTTAGMKYDDVTTQYPDPTLDVIWFRRGAQINIKSGLLSSGNLTTGSVVRIGDSTLSAGEAVNSFEMSADIYAFVGSGYAVKVENARNVNISKEFRLANAVKPIKWPATGVVPTENRQSFMMRTPGNQPGIRLVNDGMDTPTLGASPFLQLIDGYGNTALWGQIGTVGNYSKSIHKPSAASAATFNMDTNGAMWVNGGQLKLGSATDQVAWAIFAPQSAEPYDKGVGSLAIGGSSTGWNPLARALAYFPMFYTGTAWVEVNTGLVPTTAPANLAAAPTAADFNALLTALKATKILT